jgi:hypothetical protein
LTSFNLPPGCKTSDIPGFRPEDEEYDRWRTSAAVEEMLKAIRDALASVEGGLPGVANMLNEHDVEIVLKACDRLDDGPLLRLYYAVEALRTSFHEMEAEL